MTNFHTVVEMIEQERLKRDSAFLREEIDRRVAAFASAGKRITEPGRTVLRVWVEEPAVEAMLRELNKLRRAQKKLRTMIHRPARRVQDTRRVLSKA